MLKWQMFGETNRDLMALIGAAPLSPAQAFSCPSAMGPYFNGALGHGLRVVQVMTLMTTGLYNEPAGAYLPSVLY